MRNRDENIVIQMYEDFMSSYEKVIRSHGQYARYMKRSSLIEETIKKGSPKFYITEREACRIINILRKGEEIPHKNALRKQMHYDIYKIFKKYYEEYYPSMSILACVRHAINSPAPRYYISLRYAHNKLNSLCGTPL